MISNKHFSIFSLAVLLALVVAAVRPFAALADGETLPPDAPVSDEVPPAAEDLSIPEAQEQLPEDTALVIVDENGEAMPLASQGAAEAVATADPYFWDESLSGYIGFSTTGLCPQDVIVCNQSATPIQAAVDAFANSQTANGYIYIEQGNYIENVNIDAETNNFANLYGLKGSGNVIISGNMNLYGLPDTFWLEDLNIKGSLYASNFSGTLNIVNSTIGTKTNTAIELTKYSGDVYMENVTAKGACQGCRGILFSEGSGDVTIVDSNFTSAGSAATKFDATSGEVFIEGGNYQGTDQGFLFDGHKGNVTLSDVNAYGGGYGGAFLVNGNLVIDGGDFKGAQRAGAAMMITDGDVYITNATIHDSPVGIAYSVEGGTFIACNNIFSNNGADIDSGSVGTFEDCALVNPPAESSVNQPFVDDDETNTQSDDITFVAVYKSFSEGGLPSGLPSNTSFVAGTNITLLNKANGKTVEEASGVQVTMEIPVNMRGQSIRVLYWNGSEWIEVSSFVSADGKLITFLAGKAGSYVLVTP
ncbi:MAG: hypothetical protein U0V02_21935 [Anaerolineales bacterium]